MNKRFLKLLTGTVGVLALASCGLDPILSVETEVKEIEALPYSEKDYFCIPTLNYNLSVGGTAEILIDTLPERYTTDSLKYESKDTSVVTVSNDGTLTGVSKGIADVKVYSEDGQVSSYVRVVVSEKGTKEAFTTSIDSIKSAYADPNHKKPTRVYQTEYTKEAYACEGVDDHASESMQHIAFDAEEGYFMVESEDLYLKTQHGMVEKASGKWIFYTINEGQFTRLIHITPTSKAFMEVNTSDYSSNDEIIYDLLDMFFVSGRKIVTDVIDNFDGEEDFDQNTRLSSTVFYGAGENQIFTEYHEANSNQVVDIEDELKYYDIPAGTIYSYEYDQGVIQDGTNCTGMNLGITYFYERDGKNWTRKFERSMTFDGDFVLEKVSKPKDNGYTQVDSLYDL